VGEHPAIVEAPRQLGEHPAVLIHRKWSERGYDYASKFYPRPARLEPLSEAPREMGEHAAVLVARTWNKRGYGEASNTATHPGLPKVAVTTAASQEIHSRLGH
jgi:hypothetical protein